MCKVYVSIKSLFIEGQCYIFLSLEQGSCTVAASSRQNRSNNMSTLRMSINIAAKENVNVKNLVQTIVQHLAFGETINLILTATIQEQLTYIVLIVSADILGGEGSIYPSSFYRQLLNC